MKSLAPRRTRAIRPQFASAPDAWIEVVEIIERSLEHGSVKLAKLRGLIQTGLNLSDDEWQRFCLARPDLIQRINRSYAERMLKVEGGVLKKAEDNPEFGLSVLRLVDPEYRLTQGNHIDIQAAAGSQVIIAIDPNLV